MATVRRVSTGWQVRFRNAEGESRKATLRLAEETRAFQTKTEHAMLSGAYVDRTAGRQAFGSLQETF